MALRSLLWGERYSFSEDTQRRFSRCSPDRVARRPPSGVRPWCLPRNREAQVAWRTLSMGAKAPHPQMTIFVAYQPTNVRDFLSVSPLAAPEMTSMLAPSSFRFASSLSSFALGLPCSLWSATVMRMEKNGFVGKVRFCTLRLHNCWYSPLAPASSHERDMSSVWV